MDELTLLVDSSMLRMGEGLCRKKVKPVYRKSLRTDTHTLTHTEHVQTDQASCKEVRQQEN